MPLFVFSLVTVALWVFCLVDVVARDVQCIQHLPKTLWIVVILFLPTFGSILWVVAGRGPSESPDYVGVAAHIDTGNSPNASTYDPAAEEAFRQECRERAEQQRRIRRQQQDKDDPGNI